MFSKEQFNQAYQYCISFTKNEDDAFDLLHNSFEKFLKKDGNTMDNPKAYLYRIIRNQFIDDHRKKKRWQFQEYEENDSNIALLDLENLNEAWVNQDEINYILGKINPSERELLFLWACEGYTIQEIADQTDTPKGTLLCRLHRIKKKIRDQLENPYQKVKA